MISEIPTWCIIAAMAGPLHTEMLQLATRLAVESGALAINAMGTVRARRKYDESVVTTTDHAIQDHIVAAIREHFPDHAVVGEETAGDSQHASQGSHRRYCWVIDPIDGTRNYVSSFPCFATSIAVLDRAIPVVAVVREHNTERLVCAIADAGTTLNAAPVSLNDSIALTDTIVGVPSSKEPLTVSVVQLLASARGIVLRDVGATTVHLSLVASGGLAGAFCQRAKLWDVAAGSLLVKEAGGLITGAFGESFFPLPLDGDHDQNVPFLAATPQAHAHLLEFIKPLREKVERSGRRDADISPE